MEAPPATNLPNQKSFKEGLYNLSFEITSSVMIPLNLAQGSDTKLQYGETCLVEQVLAGNVILHGKRDMKRVGSRLFWQAIKVAGVGAALMLSVSAASAQSSPFAGFDGSWSGNGTVSLSDGTTERIRCKASYKVDGSGSGLQQTLRCASDSYKFDLSSNVTTQGDRIVGTWSEASRNVNGNLQGKAGGGQIEVFVEAAGFAATLNLTTHGNKQSVSISSKGEIRGVSINMVRG
jgi:hypothetical protein